MKRARYAVAQPGATAFPVIKHVDVVKQISLDLGTGLIAPMKDLLLFQTVEPAFHRRIVPAIAFPTRARHRLYVSDQRLMVMAAVLTAAVAVVNQSWL